MHRDGLVLRVHPVDDNDLVDHRDRAIGMAIVRPLDVSMLADAPGAFDF